MRIDHVTGAVDAEIESPHQVVCLALGDGVLWIGCRKRLSSHKGWLHAIDTEMPSLGAAHELPGQPRAIEVGDDGVWVASAPRKRREGEITRLDPNAAWVKSSLQTKWPVYDLALTPGSLLATMGVNVSSSFDAGSGIVFDAGGAGGGDGGGGGGGN